MLASRGFGYLSAEAAEGASIGHDSHGGRCRCSVVASWDTGNPAIEGYDPDALYQQWQFMQYQDSIIEPSNPPTDKGDSYWRNRQAVLARYGFVSNGAILEGPEIRFVERMMCRGESIEWLAAPPPDSLTGLIPTSKDFMWRGIEWELKSPALAKYSTIRRKLGEALARRHLDVVVDLGSHSLDPELRSRILSYVDSREIERLIVLSENGAVITALK